MNYWIKDMVLFYRSNMIQIQQPMPFLMTTCNSRFLILICLIQKRRRNSRRSKGSEIRRSNSKWLSMDFCRNQRQINRKQQIHQYHRLDKTRPHLETNRQWLPKITTFSHQNKDLQMTKAKRSFSNYKRQHQKGCIIALNANSSIQASTQTPKPQQMM